PTIVYPISPGGTEIRPPPIAAAPKSPDVKAPQPVVSPPYPWPASNLPRTLPTLTAPPEVPNEMRGTSVRVEGDSFTNDCSGGLGSAGGSSEGREGLEWFYNGLKRVFATYGGDHDGRAEEVKTSTAELQKLVINDGDKEVSPLLAGDWLTLAGLHLILKAIPNSLKEELVSTQRMSCIDAVSLPDSTLLLAGLDLLTSKALSKFPAELEVLDTGIAKTTKAAKVEDTIDACPYRGKGSAGTGDGGSKGKGAKGGKKGSEEQPKGDAGAAADAAQTALHCVFVPDGKVKNRIEQWENDAGQQSTMNAEGVALIHEAMQGMGIADYAEGLCRAIEVDDGGEGIITAWTEALLRTMYPAVPDNVCDEVSRFLPGMHDARSHMGYRILSYSLSGEFVLGTRSETAAEAITNMADVWKRYHDNAESLKALAKRKVLESIVEPWGDSAAFGSGPPNNNESVAAAPVRSTLAGQQVNGFAGALDAETGGFDDALEVPCEASLAAPVRNTLAGQRFNGSGGVLDVGTGGFDTRDDGILEAPGVDLMRFCGDDCEAIGVGEFGGFDWGVDSVVLEASEFGFPDGCPQSGDDESLGSSGSAGFEDCESRALSLKALIARESKSLSREPEGSDDRDVAESTLVHAVKRLLQAQDKAAAQVPSEIEYSLLPDCEVLSTHTVPLPEVYKYFSRWRGSAEAELYSLIDDKKAFKRITLADIRRLEAEGARVTIVPGKAIFTRKSGGRYKTRIVICGNFVPEGWGEDGSGQQKASLYAAGCEVAHVRQIAARGAKAKWAGYILDIKTAFLNSLLLDPFKPRTAPAPTLTDNPTELIAVRPPKVLIAHGLADKDEFYLCLRAVYGLPQSPRDWGITRDQTITDMRISVSISDFTEVELSTLDPMLREAIGKEMVLVPSAADSQVWSLRLPNVSKDGEPGQALAWIAVYVDDLFIMGQRVFALALVNKFRATWETGSVKEIPDLSQGTAAFFGIEFAWKGDQLLLGQQGYIRDLQTRYPHIKMQCVPLPPGNIDIPEVSPEERDPSALRSCQGMLGEVLWVAMRTRPDLMFGVSKLASSMSRNPTGTLPYIEHLLGYVFNTVDTVLAYSADDRTQELSCGIASEALHHITVHTDACFAPAAGRSHECVIAYQDGCLVTWLSSKQPFTAQSTAEEFQADNVGIGYVPGVSNGADLGTKSEEADVLSEAQPDDEDNGSRRSSASPS
ncbi:GIP, partial [Symbiodinium sp. CCMP2592]